MHPKMKKFTIMKGKKLQTIRKTISDINREQIAADRAKVEKIFKFPENALRIFDKFCKTPELDISTLSKELSEYVSRQNLTRSIKKLCREGVINKVVSDKKWGTKYRYDALYGSAADFAHNTTRSQNANGLFLYFDGMERAEALANTPSKVKFHPYKYHNDKTNNVKSGNKLFIGDNLDVMKFIMPEYEEKVDLAYFDIPYNMPSNRTVQAYDDSFDGTCDLLAHLYPRLVLVRRLLKQDGILALSVSEHEECYVKALMDRAFGRSNLINNVVIEMAAPAGVLSGFTQHRLIPVKSYLLLYSRDHTKVHLNRLYDFSVSTKFAAAFNTIILCEEGKNPLCTQIPLIDYLKKQPGIVQMFKKHGLTVQTNNIEKLMDLEADFEDYVYQKLSKILFKATRPVANPLKNDFNAPTDRVFLQDGRFYIKKENGVVYHFKSFFDKLHKNDSGELVNTNIRTDIWKGYYSEKSKIQSEGGNITFNGGKKPVRLIRDIIKMCSKKDLLLFDGYSGSGTSAESVMVQNSCDNGTRRFILCQIPEPVNPKSEEGKAGFKTVDQITIKRIKNVIKQHPGEGFQIFR